MSLAAALNAAIDRLPPDQRVMARKNPRAFFGQYAAGQFPEVPSGFELSDRGYRILPGVEALHRMPQPEPAPPGFRRGAYGQLEPLPNGLAVHTAARLGGDMKPLVSTITEYEPLDVGDLYVREAKAEAFREAVKRGTSADWKEWLDLVSEEDWPRIGQDVDRLVNHVTAKARAFRSKPQTQAEYETFNADWKDPDLFTAEERASFDKPPEPEPRPGQGLLSGEDHGHSES